MSYRSNDSAISGEYLHRSDPDPSQTDSVPDKSAEKPELALEVLSLRLGGWDSYCSLGRYYRQPGEEGLRQVEYSMGPAVWLQSMAQMQQQMLSFWMPWLLPSSTSKKSKE